MLCVRKLRYDEAVGVGCGNKLCVGGWLNDPDESGQAPCCVLSFELVSIDGALAAACESFECVNAELRALVAAYYRDCAEQLGCKSITLAGTELFRPKCG